MYSENKTKPSKVTASDHKYRSCSRVSDSGISGSASTNDDVDQITDIPLLHRLLEFKTSESEIFKSINEENYEEDNISLLEFPFSDDDEEMLTQQPIRTDEMKTKLDDENSQFSDLFLEIIEEIDAEKGPFSLPCSTCSLCSSYTTDTWERLDITEDGLMTRPTELEPAAIERLAKINNEHSELINTLLSNVTLQDIDVNLSTESNDQQLKEQLRGFKKQYEGEKLQDVASEKEKLRKRRSMYKKQLNISQEWSKLSEDDDLFITPPGFNYYRDARLRKGIRFERDGIPWSIKEKSKNKCRNWLNAYHN